MFNPSLIKVLDTQPWRWTDETETETQTLDGVFVLMSDALVDRLAALLTSTNRTELRGWVLRISRDECGEWHVPYWGGSEGAVYLRVPAAIWDDPTAPPPLKVRQYFADLYDA